MSFSSLKRRKITKSSNETENPPLVSFLNPIIAPGGSALGFGLPPSSNLSSLQPLQSVSSLPPPSIALPTPSPTPPPSLPPAPHRSINLNADWDPSEDTTLLQDPDILRFQAEDALARQRISEKLLLVQNRISSSSSSSTSSSSTSSSSSSSSSSPDRKPFALMTSRDWRAFRDAHAIVTQGIGVPLPVRSWDEANLPPSLLQAIAQAGYQRPTPVQMQAIPIGLKGVDLLASAATGSGKTAAFLVPMIARLLTVPELLADFDPRRGPVGLILAPTRELASQIFSEACKFGASVASLRFEVVYGGVPLREQVASLQGSPYHILIATPGRLIDLLQEGYVVLQQTVLLVLDEADRMIDFGFEPQLAAILASLPATQPGSAQPIKRHFCMFSATFPPQIVSMARAYLTTPIRLSIGKTGKVVSTVEQKIVWLDDPKAKFGALKKVIEAGPPPLIIVFAGTKVAVDDVCHQLERIGCAAIAIHSGKSQEMRDAAISRFREGQVQVLVATDVAGRGIDIPNVNHVIQYDVARDILDYTHRVGRTGRAGNHGLATAFVTPGDVHIMYDLVKMAAEAKISIPAPLQQHPASSIPYQTYLKYHSQSSSK